MSVEINGNYYFNKITYQLKNKIKSITLFVGKNDAICEF